MEANTLMSCDEDPVQQHRSTPDQQNVTCCLKLCVIYQEMKPELKLDLGRTVTDVFIELETALPVSKSPQLYILVSFLERKAVPSYSFIYNWIS